MKKKLLIIIFLLFQTKNPFAVMGMGDIVFDPTAATNFVQQLQIWEQMIQQNTEMAKQIGDGKFTPQTLNWANNWYNKCGGGKFVLPDWFPHPKIDICGGTNESVKNGVDWYRQNYIVLSTDSLQTIQKKEKANNLYFKQLQALSLAKSMEGMARGEEDQKAIDSFNSGLKSSTSQIEIAKIQTQAMIQILAELQKLNEKQAYILQTISFGQ